jgi:PAS domain S-box-containing protein
VILAMAGFSSTLVRRLVDAKDRVNHTHAVLTAIQALRIDLADVEDTGEPSPEIGERVRKSAAVVARLILDNPRQQGRMRRLQATLERTLGGATGRADPKRDVVVVLTAMEDEERALLAQRDRQSTATAQESFLLLPLGVYVAVSMLTVGLSLLNAGMGAQAKAQSAVADNQARLAGVVGGAMDAIITVDREQRIVLFNAAAEKMFRRSAHEALGRPIDVFIPPRHRGSHARHIGEFGATGVTSRSMGLLGTISGLRADGEEFPIEASISQAEAGGQKLYTVILRDVTERVAAQEALGRQGRLFDQSYDAILAWGWGGPITFWNRGAEHLYGFLRHAAIGRRPQELLRSTTPGGWAALLAALEGAGFWEGELEHSTHDGARITVESRMVLVREGERAYVLETNRDITERRRVEDAVRELNADLERRVAERTAELESANKELEAFSYSVSHDLRSPLRTVDGFSQALLEDFGPTLPEEGRRQVRTIREGAQRMGALIDDLLAFSRLGRQALARRQPLNMERLVQDTLDELLPRRNDDLVVVRIGELPPSAGDGALVKQVWTNLLSNAIKYSAKRERPVVEVGSERNDGGIVYFVRDNGVGFDMRYAKKLFGVFQRLHRAEDFEGTGVGLAIVQRIVQRHGGRIWAEASPNAGATFRFTLTGGAS